MPNKNQCRDSFRQIYSFSYHSIAKQMVEPRQQQLCAHHMPIKMPETDVVELLFHGQVLKGVTE